MFSCIALYFTALAFIGMAVFGPCHVQAAPTDLGSVPIDTTSSGAFPEWDKQSINDILSFSNKVPYQLSAGFSHPELSQYMDLTKQYAVTAKYLCDNGPQHHSGPLQPDWLLILNSWNALDYLCGDDYGAHYMDLSLNNAFSTAEKVLMFTVTNATTADSGYNRFATLMGAYMASPLNVCDYQFNNLGAVICPGDKHIVFMSYNEPMMFVING